MEDGRLLSIILKNWKSSSFVFSQLKWYLPTSLARSRGLSAMPEGSHSALYQGPMGEESPQLSSPLSTREHDQANIDLGPHCYSQLCVEPLDGERERPVSLVSTLSSGSSRDSHSLFGSTIALPSSTTPPIPSEEDIDLELSPAEGSGEQAGHQSPILRGSSGCWQERLEPRICNQWNSNNSSSTRKVSCELPHNTTSPVVTDTMAPNPKLTYVDRVVMEIIETERMYVKDLRSIVEDYLAHIIDMRNLPIRPEQVCALFGNIEDIYEFNSELLQSLDMCENDPVAIARCFVDKSEYFEIYTQYCTNYPNSVAALTDCMTSKTLAKFFRDRQATLKRSLPLGSYLLKPVQRILKYHLLLQEIAKHFDPDEDGYEVIQEAIDTMTGVAWYINDMKRKHEHAVRVQEIQSLLINWKGADLTTYGELVLEGTFHVLRAKNTRTLFLFEKMLLITKKRGEHYVYKIHISCSTLMLLDSAKDPLLFSVIHFKHPKQPQTVRAKSVEEKRLWAQHIKRLILENHNTIIPEKAKEAILDNSNYPGKYNYSLERLKKAEFYQADNVHLGGRNRRRQSEPAKQIIRSTKAVLKDDQDTHTDELKTTLKEEAETQRLEENDVAVKENPTTQVNMEELCPPDCVLQGKESNQLEVHYSLSLPESPVSPAQQEAESPEVQDTSKETGEEGGGDSDSSGLQVEETSVLTNGEFSEEEEDVLDNKSILPSSVLDQASVIAERFIGSLSRQSSLVSEDLGSLTCPSPTIEKDVFKSSSACMDLEKQTQMLASSFLEPQTNSESNSSTPAYEPTVDTLIEGERRSTLSKQDRLLIHKIRRYYEHAEHQDANFSIKRRESLSYIPPGLVRNLSQQLNSIPQEQDVPVHRKGLSRNRPTSWSVFDLPGLEKSRNTETHQKTEPQKPMEVEARSQSITDGSSTEEEFRPSSDMIKVWKDMEVEEESQEVHKTEEEKVNESRLDVSQDSSLDISDVEAAERPSQILEESEISTASESCSISSPTTTSPAGEEKSVQDSNPSNTPLPQEKCHVNPGQPPKIISFRTGMAEDQILQDMGKMKSKVFQLARQYSQRIKNNRPIVWQRNRETANQQGFKNMPEITLRKKGKPNLRLPFNTCNQVVIQEVCSPSPVETPSSTASSQSTVTCPQSPQSETFHWPDVQELRSKYTETSYASKVTHSCTSPSGMLQYSMGMCNGCSYKHNSFSDLHSAPSDCSTTQSNTVYKEMCPTGEDWPQPQSRFQPLLCRWRSLDHMLGSFPLHEVQNLEQPVRTCCTDGKPQDGGNLFQDGQDCEAKSPLPSSGKISESNLVKNLREKFQSLGTSS
ncbi:pleckstrin homology domain-containing family G member 3-like isoform X4 [Mastacembelus armatus]|uniref:Pleckstrin homology domain-containing family G member 3-like n=1 Tax=Mastacembelus armatus TaxID=205130 RepID=A0A3Q3LCA9_9TELE|nr:pleckstrin homology domain-containing family G member 3-like isoform X4 [Mastacembelus armatus]